MKRWNKKWVLVILVVLLAVLAVGYFGNPLLRVKVFVVLHSEELTQRIALANPEGREDLYSPSVPTGMGIRTFNLWPGTHDMIEFSLFASGFGSETTYYGCYYSFDDVPLAFQNGDVDLVQNGHDYWEWKGEGDNWGATQKLADNWYYFEASF